MAAELCADVFPVPLRATGNVQGTALEHEDSTTLLFCWRDWLN